MRGLIVFLLFLIFSVWLGLEAVRHPGYLLLVYHHWMIQMPLWFVFVSLIAVFILFYIVIDSIDRFQFFWYRIKSWFHRRQERQSYSKTQMGLAFLIEGRWKKAEKFLLAGASQSFEPLMNYLAAAKAAHEQNADDRADSYIQKAYRVAPRANLAIGLTQAALQLKQHQYEQAIATLTHLQQSYPRHPRVLKLLEKAYVHLSDWQQLQALLPALRKSKVLTSEQSQQFEKNIYCEILRASANKSLSDLRQVWDHVPRYMRKNPDVIYEYVKQLSPHVAITGSDTSKEIEDLVRQVLKHTWYPSLVKIYGTLPFNQLNRQLVIVGAWLKTYGQQPELLLVLGKLCAKVQLWGKAKDYFEKCLAMGPNSDASLQYGKLLEQLGETDQAMQVYRKGLANVE